MINRTKAYQGRVGVEVAPRPRRRSGPFRLAESFAGDREFIRGHGHDNDASAALGWHSGQVVCFAGRLAYTQYGFVKRFIMRQIARREGGPIDVTRDHELTRWDEVARFADVVGAWAKEQTPGTNVA
jgi:Flavodoxin domain